jgi:pilus assembly protein CpaE
MTTLLIPEVLIVDPLNRDLEQLLSACGMRTARASAADLAALAQPTAQCPDVVVVDTRGTRAVPPSMAGVKRQHPAIGFLVVASDSDPAVLIEAMRAGATEFLQEPITAAALDQAISRLVAHRVSPTAAGQVFAFVGAKGGVGTTTMAVNVATVLAKLSKSPTLLADLHVAYGDAAVFLGAEPRFSLLDALENMDRLDAEFLKSLVVKTASGLELLASADRPASAPIDTRRTAEIVQLASSQYAYTVLDVPRSDPTVLDNLDHLDHIVVVVNQELATVRNAGRMTTALRSRYPNAKVMTVINRIDARAEIGQREVQKALGTTSAHEFPSDYRRALTAMHTGRPVALDNHNQLSASMTALARELAGLERVKTEKSSGGLRALLTGRR